MTTKHPKFEVFADAERALTAAHANLHHACMMTDAACHALSDMPEPVNITFYRDVTPEEGEAMFKVDRLRTTAKQLHEILRDFKRRLAVALGEFSSDLTHGQYDKAQAAEAALRA